MMRSHVGRQLRRWSKLTSEELGERLRVETEPPRVEYNTLAESVVPTMHFQKSLPRLPIPKLEDTCKKYVRTVTPLLSEAELEKTKRVVADFENGKGKDLHERLVAKDKLNKHTSYISDDWYDMYLQGRTPLPLNWTPFLVFRKDPTPSRNTQIHRAAAFVHASLLFKKAFDSGKLTPEVFHLNPKRTKQLYYQKMAAMLPESVSSYLMFASQAYPLDMSQFPRLFGTTRLPQPAQDVLQTADTDYIVVFYKGRPFKVNVFEGTKSDSNPNMDFFGQKASPRTPVPVEQIAARLREIVAGSSHDGTDEAHPIGALTSDNRDVWAAARAELEKDPQNKRSLETIDRALFVLCLDSEEVTFNSQEEVTAMGRTFLHGNPQKSNRWWDKSLSVIVSRNGYVCCQFEHSWGDGVAVMRWANDVWHTSCESTESPKEAACTDGPELLTFNLSDASKNSVKKSIARFQTDVDRLRYDVSVYPDLGKNLLKKMKVSPDAFMQQAFQLAFRRLYGETRSTYESASTSAFKGGRTEAVRPATIEGKEFCMAMQDPSVSDAKRTELLRRAMKQHGVVTKDALTGKGIDRHLFALRKIAQKAGEGDHELFTDRGYEALGENIISTSTLYNDCLCLGGFGPVHPEGLGLGYSPAPGLLFLGATSYSRDCREYTNAVWGAVDEMRHLLLTHKE